MLRICYIKTAVFLFSFAMLLAVYSRADAVEFKVGGEWIVGFAVGDGSLIRKEEGHNVTANDDTFGARQRFRLQLDAVANEVLSGTLFFEIGDQTWGRNADDDGVGDQGGALGADGTRAIKLKNAYIDWIAPLSKQDLRIRMGIQALTLPNAAGGSAILDTDVAAISASYLFNENIALTVAWMRPLNDNFAGWTLGGNPQRHSTNYLDNMDLLVLSLPITFEGIRLTPWVMYGILGKYALNCIDGEDHYQRVYGNRDYSQPEWKTNAGELSSTLTNYLDELNDNGLNDAKLSETNKPYFSMFWVGLPVVIDIWDPLRIEFDINYGYVESIGRYDVLKRGQLRQRADSRRQGWLAKALVEYKFDWGIPGIFGWYASGDDGDMKNGSERIPSIAGAASFTSFSGYGGLDWGAKNGMVEWQADYSGTWGVGLQLRDLSFLEDLKHTIRVAWWGGTNSPSMVEYMESRHAWNEGGIDNPYLTTHDSLLEINLDNKYKIYENFTVHLDLGYVFNMVDTDTWNRSWMEPETRDTQKQDAWKAQVAFVYSF